MFALLKIFSENKYSQLMVVPFILLKISSVFGCLANPHIQDLFQGVFILILNKWGNSRFHNLDHE